jgi:hypothetical protein
MRYLGHKNFKSKGTGAKQFLGCTKRQASSRNNSSELKSYPLYIIQLVKN